MSEIQIISQPAVTEIVINRPEKKNALTREMYKTMGDAIIEADASEACKVVLTVTFFVRVTKFQVLRIMAKNRIWLRQWVS